MSGIGASGKAAGMWPIGGPDATVSQSTGETNGLPAKAVAYAGATSDVGSNAGNAVGVAVEVAKSEYDGKSK